MSTPIEIVDALLARGLTVLDQREHLGLTVPVTGCVYLGRASKVAHAPDQHQRVSVCSYDNRFLEAVLEVYHVGPPRKNAPGGMTSHDRMVWGYSPIYAMIRRDLASILSDLDAPHPLPPRPPKRS